MDAAPAECDLPIDLASASAEQVCYRPGGVSSYPHDVSTLMKPLHHGTAKVPVHILKIRFGI